MNVTAQIISLEDAAELLSSGDGVWVGGALTIENPLIELLSDRRESIKGITIVGSTEAKQDDIFNPKYSGALRIVSIHNVCQSGVGEGSFAQQSGEQFCRNVCSLFGLNTVALRMSPPDADGNCAVEADSAALTDAICGFEGITKRIAMLDLSQKTAAQGDGRAKISIKDFDYICSYKCKDVESSIA